jgi:hypothetical protein
MRRERSRCGAYINFAKPGGFEESLKAVAAGKAQLGRKLARWRFAYDRNGSRAQF